MILSMMLIDDNLIDQKHYKRLIDRSGLVETLMPFTSAEDALEALRKGGDVSAILLDINMPRMDGFEFLEYATAELGDALSNAVVIVMTTSVASHDKARAEAFPAVKGYFSKPLKSEDIARIDSLVAERG